MNAVTIGGFEYGVGKIDARSQFHIARRLAPVISGLVLAYTGSVSQKEAFDGLAKALASLSDDDADYCLFGLLACVSRKQAGGLGFAPICVAGQRALVFPDIDMKQMLELAAEAFKVNLSGFFQNLS